MSNAVEKFNEFMDKKSMTKEQVSSAFDKAVRTMEGKSFLDKQEGCWKHEPVLITVNPEMGSSFVFTRKAEVYLNVCTMSQSNSRSTIRITEAALDELIKALVETRSELGALRKAYNEELAKLPAEEEKQD